MALKFVGYTGDDFVRVEVGDPSFAIPAGGVFKFRNSIDTVSALEINENTQRVTVGSLAVQNTVLTEVVDAFVLGTGTTKAPQVPQMTTAQKNALTPSFGMLVFDTDLVAFHGYGGVWAALGGGGGLPTGLYFSGSEAGGYILDQGTVGQVVGDNQLVRFNINNQYVSPLGPPVGPAALQPVEKYVGSSGASPAGDLNIVEKVSASNAHLYLYNVGVDPEATDSNTWLCSLAVLASAREFVLSDTITVVVGMDQLVGDVLSDFDGSLGGGFPELVVGDLVETAGSQIRTIIAIADAQNATVSKVWSGSEAGVVGTRHAVNKGLHLSNQSGEGAVTIGSTQGTPGFLMDGFIPFNPNPCMDGVRVEIQPCDGGPASGDYKGGLSGAVRFKSSKGGPAVDGERGSGGDGQSANLSPAGKGGDGSTTALPGSGGNVYLDAGGDGMSGPFGNFKDLTGLCDTNVGTLFGVGTLFTTELLPGDKIRTATGMKAVVVSITDDFNAVVDQGFGSPELGVVVTRYVESGWLLLGTATTQSITLGNSSCEIYQCEAWYALTTVQVGTYGAYRIKDTGPNELFRIDTGPSKTSLLTGEVDIPGILNVSATASKFLMNSDQDNGLLLSKMSTGRALLNVNFTSQNIEFGNATDLPTFHHWGPVTLTLKDQATALYITDEVGNVIHEIDATGGAPAAQKISWFGTAPAFKAAALTAKDAGVVNSGDATTDGVIANNRTRIEELEGRLQLYGLLS